MLMKFKALFAVVLAVALLCGVAAPALAPGNNAVLKYIPSPPMTTLEYIFTPVSDI